MWGKSLDKPTSSVGSGFADNLDEWVLFMLVEVRTFVDLLEGYGDAPGLQKLQ